MASISPGIVSATRLKDFRASQEFSEVANTTINVNPKSEAHTRLFHALNQFLYLQDSESPSRNPP